MAGLAERRGSDADSFWSWRETMYAFAARITPDDLQAIAAQLYVELLRGGYTQVCEFHYLHHEPDGHPYADPAAMSRALFAAADEAGIGITLLPVLYMQGGFDGRALSKRQTRFGHNVDAFLRLFGTLRAEQTETRRVGIAFHSLRAVRGRYAGCSITRASMRAGRWCTQPIWTRLKCRALPRAEQPW